MQLCCIPRVCLTRYCDFLGLDNTVLASYRACVTCVSFLGHAHGIWGLARAHRCIACPGPQLFDLGDATALAVVVAPRLPECPVW